MSGIGRADGPSNPGEGGEERFEEAEGITSTSTEDTGAEAAGVTGSADPAARTAEGAVEPPD